MSSQLTASIGVASRGRLRARCMEGSRKRRQDYEKKGRDLWNSSLAWHSQDTFSKQVQFNLPFYKWVRHSGLSLIFPRSFLATISIFSVGFSKNCLSF